MRAAILLLALAAAVAAPSPARAHGEASWIMENAKTSWCCGPKDCRPLEAGEAARGAMGWAVNGHPVPAAAVYPTADGTARFWACFVAPELRRPRCLFTPALF